jgi:hypothetical protein
VIASLPAHSLEDAATRLPHARRSRIGRDARLTG